VNFLAFVALAVIAALFAALGVFFVWLPFSGDPPDTATYVLIGFGCFMLAVALSLAGIARRAWRLYKE
jgi:hypothetical protein